MNINNGQWIVKSYSDWFTIKPGTLIKTATDKNMTEILLAIYHYKSDRLMKINELHDCWYYPSVGNRLPVVYPEVVNQTLMFIEVVNNFNEDFSKYGSCKDWRALKFLSGKHVVGLLLPNLQESLYPYCFDVL